MKKKQVKNETIALIIFLLIGALILLMPKKSKGQFSVGIGSGISLSKGSVAAANVQLQVQLKAKAFVISYTQTAHPNLKTPSMFQLRIGADVYNGITPYIGSSFHLKTTDDENNPYNGIFNGYGMQYNRNTWYINAGMSGKYLTSSIGCHYTFD